MFGVKEENPRYILPYLIGSDESLPIVSESPKSLNNLPKIKMGSKPIDGGHYIFTDVEKNDFLEKEPHAKPFLMPYVGAKEFLNGERRWISKLHDIEPGKLRKLPEIQRRIKAVKSFRLQSKDTGTRKLAETPRHYHLNVIPDNPFLVLPGVTSERREYVPLGYLKPPIIPSDATIIIENASLDLFGLLISKMHMVWLDVIGGKLEGRFRYSIGIIYNTFPLPEKNYTVLKSNAQKILDVRRKYPNSTLVDLYDPITMSSDLRKAHIDLDRAVDKLYRTKPFKNEGERINFLLLKYKQMIDES